MARAFFGEHSTPLDRGAVVQMFFYPANREGPRVDVSCLTIGDEASNGGEGCLRLEECLRRVRVVAPWVPVPWECTSLKARRAWRKGFSRAGWKSVRLRDVADWSVSFWRKRWTLPAWLYSGRGTVDAHFPCHWPLQRKNRSNVVQKLPQRGRLHHIFGKSMEIV